MEVFSMNPEINRFKLSTFNNARVSNGNLITFCCSTLYELGFDFATDNLSCVDIQCEMLSSSAIY